MSFPYIKALHIIFVVTWFAGLFYIPRLFIYFTEAAEKPDPEREILQRQFSIMQKRLWYGITWPSAIITLLIGFYLLHWAINAYGTVPTWLGWKLGFVLGLYGYHMLCHRIFKQQQQGILNYTSGQLRLWNEVATIFLVSIVFLVVLKNAMSMLWALIGLVIFIVLLMLAIKVYKRIREKSQNP